MLDKWRLHITPQGEVSTAKAQIIRHASIYQQSPLCLNTNLLLSHIKL